MEEGSIPHNPEANDISELLREERKAVLSLAGTFHTQAHELRGRNIGTTFDLYMVTDDHDIPFTSEKIRIEPWNTRVAEISEAHLYFPIDTDFREENEEHTMPNIFFFNIRYKNGSMLRGIFSELTIWRFAEEESMVIDADKLPKGQEELDIPAVFPTSSDLHGEDEYKLLQDFKLILNNRNRYRLGRQERENSD